VKTSDFDYVLPESCIAAFPATRRDGSRLLRIGRFGGPSAHSEFARIGEHLPPRSLIVLNDTRVIPARLRGHKPTGGAIELLLTRCAGVPGDDANEMRWEALGRNLGWAAVGTELALDGGLTAAITRRGAAGAVEVILRAPVGTTVMRSLDRVGELPLPPYIEVARHRRAAITADPEGAPSAVSRDAATLLDRERYQTVFATHAGAVAAPTAGLHFTGELLRRLETAGHEIVRLTLHVGLGTFRPVKSDAPDGHEMESEWYAIPEHTATAVNDARRASRPVVAVGTTVVRALESSALKGGGSVVAGEATSRLFLRPGARFGVVTDLITNFHLPRSTLLMLVSAFAGRERVLGAYEEAIAAGYRFYSYGDAMLIRGTA
jgi:S-adenosylmethionine:tRNA ribosyltransferase-isomerase